jgi:transposase
LLLIGKEMDMSHSFSTDLRGRVISVISDGFSTRKAAARFGVGVSTAGEWYRRYRDNGETAARKQGQPPGSKLDAHEAFILGLVKDTSDISLEEIAGRLLAERSVSAVPSTVWTFFKKRGMTYKKRRRMPANSNAAT